METKVLNHRQVMSYLALAGFDFFITHHPGSTNPADGPSRRPDYMAEAQKPSQKYNQAFVKPMQDLLYKGSREGAALVYAVTTRAGKNAKNGPAMAEAWNEFRKAERALQTGLSAQEGCNMTEDDTDATSSNSEAKLGQPGPANQEVSSKRRIGPKTLEEKAKALEECHYDPLAGHFGTRKTQEKLSRL
jgi:hypothetical protein